MQYRLYRNLFIILLFCEILLLTSQRMRYMGQRENSLVMLFITIALGILAMLSAFKQVRVSDRQQEPQWEPWLLKTVTVIGVSLCAFHFYREISVIPITVQLSDIVPTIQVMNKRILQGQYAYDIIRDFGYDLSPTYLPLMWLPFLPAAIFHFDERWVAFVIWAIAAVLFIRRAQLTNLKSEAKWLITVLPFFCFIIIEEGTDATYGNTIELMIAGFYMLFALQLDKIRDYLSGDPRKKGAVLAFFMILCLLSRYSFLLWLPLLFVIVWTENRRLAISTVSWVLVYVLLLYVFPFLLKDPMIYVNGIKHYSEGALIVWMQPDRTGPLYDGLGVANIFRDELGGEMAERLSALQRWQVLTSLAATGLCAWIWWKKRAQIKNLSLFLLGSLKFYFAFFYGFIQMPYVYLMISPCFLSILVLLSFYREQMPALEGGREGNLL